MPISKAGWTPGKETKCHSQSGLNQRDRATGGFVGGFTHRKPGNIFYWRGFACKFGHGAGGGFAVNFIHSRSTNCDERENAHPPPCARWPGTPGSRLAGHFFWVLVWAGACYWHGVGGFVFNSPSSRARERENHHPAVAWLHECAREHAHALRGFEEPRRPASACVVAALGVSPSSLLRPIAICRLTYLEERGACVDEQATRRTAHASPPAFLPCLSRAHTCSHIIPSLISPPHNLLSYSSRRSSAHLPPRPRTLFLARSKQPTTMRNKTRERTRR